MSWGHDMPELTLEQQNEFFKYLGLFVSLVSVVESNFNRVLRELLQVSDKLGRALVGKLGKPVLGSLIEVVRIVGENTDMKPARLAFLKEICAEADDLSDIRNMVAHNYLEFDDGMPTFTNQWSAKSEGVVFILPCTTMQLRDAFIFGHAISEKLEMFMLDSWDTEDCRVRLAVLRTSCRQTLNLPQTPKMFHQAKGAKR